MKKILIYFLLILTISLTGCDYTSSDIDKYLETGSALDGEAISVMPILDNLPKSEDMKYAHTHKNLLMFESDSVVLEVVYNENTYEEEKNKLNNQFIFFKGSSLDEDTGKSEDYKAIEDYTFKMESYVFKIVAKDSENNTGVPKSFGMIGTSDEKKAIAYLYFYDFDLDTLGTEMVDFIHEYFDYDF